MRTGKAALYEDLKRHILTMALAPDELLDEASLTAQYGLSRTPVREVFQRLAGEGYLEIVEKRGVRVIPLSHATLRNFFLVAPMVYAATGRLAVQHYKPAQLKGLKETQKRFRKAMLSKDAEALALENNRFHEIMGEMAANPYLQPSLGRLLIDHCRIGHTFFRPQNDDMARRLALAADHHDAFSKPVWGVIPAHPFGSTVRRTIDNRILVRNSFSFHPDGRPRDYHLKSFIARHRKSFERRFPTLNHVDFEYSWSGAICLSENHEGFFGQLAPNVYGALCCNGLGITRGTATGKLLADMIAGENNALINFLRASPGPNKTPPQPFLSVGVNSVLKWGQYRAGLEL